MIYIIVFSIFSLVIIYFYCIEPIVLQQKIKNNSEYGSARFSSISEIKHNFTIQMIDEINKVGFPIYFDKKLKNTWLDYNTPHWVYLGSTGSGKSVTQVIPYCSFLSSAKEKRSVFITDPKGEIYATTSNMFQNNGYQLITIDFRNPEYSNKINFLEPIIKEYEEYIKHDRFVFEVDVSIIDMEKQLENIENNDNKIKIQKDIEELKQKNFENNNEAMKHLAEAYRLIKSISNMIMESKKANDPFWNNSARTLLEGLIALFLEDYKEGIIKREQITLTSIKKFQTSSLKEENFKILQEKLNEKEYGSLAKDALLSVFSSAENTYKSITAVFAERMAIFDDVNVANIVSENDFEFSILGQKPVAFYIIVPDEDKVYYSLVTIIISCMYKELVKLANSNEDKKLPIQIDWLLDEFANCPPLADIEAIVSVARSRGMRFHFFIQSFSQLDNVYGKDVAQIILDNCGLVYLKTNTQETAEAISRRLGKQTIEANSISHSFSSSSDRGSKSTSLIARDLMTADEIKQLHYKMIIFPNIGYPIIRKTIMYNKFSTYKSGLVQREKRNLKDLSFSYHSIEVYSKENVKDDIKEEYKDFFEEVLFLLKDIFRNNNLNYKIYVQEEIVPICEVTLEEEINGRQKDQLVALENEGYHIEIEENNKIFKVIRLAML